MLAVARGRHIHFPLLTRILRVWRTSFPRLSWRSDTDCQTAQECLMRTVSCISNIERCTSSLHFNHLLCERFVTNYLRRARELLEERKDDIELYSEQCAPTLTALYSTVKESEFLIQKHCTGSNWIRAAVELVENTCAFSEVILDLKWYIHALRIALEFASGNTPRQSRRQKVWDLQNLAMKEYGNFLESWESDCKQLRLQRDREVLLSKLKNDSGAEIRSLGSYLAQKLGQQDQSMHAREALAVNLKASEVLNNKVLLGLGSFGRVYKVQWLGIPCALKQIDEKTAIDEEVRILSKLHHPNIIQLYGYFLERGTLYLIMELMDKTLSEYIQTKEWTDLQRSPFFLPVALDCMLQIAKGMRYLHSRGMVHRDLKGDNVLVKPSENPELRGKGYLTVKLTDFGMAKANLRNSTCTSLTMNVGSLVWKAPELFKVVQSDSSKCSKRKHYPFKPDVYSFGMVCYEIFCGEKPFSNTPKVPTSSFYAKVKKGGRPELPENIFPPGLADYIRRCWDTDPCRRPDFVDICKRIRHFRDYLLQITAYVGWEHKSHESRAVIQELPTIDIDENDFMIDITGDWNWEIDYKNIVRGDKQIPGGSGFASVWPARLKTTDQQVLAKYIEVTLIDNDASIANFKHEVELLVRMQHENLVSYLGATTHPHFMVVTEFAHGVTLRKFSGKRTPFSHRDAVNIALQVARGMRSLHEDQITIIHGELSPDCILIDENTMTARVADFGMQSFRKPPHSHSHSRWFRRAPEHHLGLPLHTSVDVFSFGMILYELFEREKAQHFWKNKKASELLKGGRRPELDLASCYPRGVRALIERCWTQNWQERPSFGSIVSDLQKMATQLSRSTSINRSNSNRERQQVPRID